MSNIEYKYIPEHKTKLWKKEFRRLIQRVWSKKTLSAVYGISTRSLNTKIKNIDNFGIYVGRSFTILQLKKIIIELGFPKF